MDVKNKLEYVQTVDHRYSTPGNEMVSLREDALQMLAATSRTFYIPISRLPDGLLEAVGSGYLCLRAIDEIEDHSELEAVDKIYLLQSISNRFQSITGNQGLDELREMLLSYCKALPEVTLRLGDWANLAPQSIAPRIWDVTATMAERMSGWVASDFLVQTEADLDRYTFGVAGAVGLMLSDLWAWYNGTRTDRGLAVGFGRGLQAVNILRNRAEDVRRGADFFPCGWGYQEMYAYARRNLSYAGLYEQSLPAGPVQDFCRIPLALAYATLEAHEQGREKLSREEVLQVLQQLSKFSGRKT